MKIRNQKDVEALHDKIQDELGIDVYKYKDKEIAENISELLIFPQYVLKCILRPVIIVMIVFILSFFIINLDGYENFIYGIFGFILYTFCALTIGLLFLMLKIKSDLLDVITYSLDIMESAVIDLNHVSAQTNRTNRKDVLNLLFTGIIHIVTIPMVSQILAGRIPWIGGLVKNLIIRILTLVNNKINFVSKEVSLDFNAESEQSEIINTYIQIIEASKSNVRKVLNISLTITQIPIFVITAISVFLLICFVLFMHWL